MLSIFKQNNILIGNKIQKYREKKPTKLQDLCMNVPPSPRSKDFASKLLEKFPRGTPAGLFYFPANLKNHFWPISQLGAQIRWLIFSGWYFCPAVHPPRNLCVCWQVSWMRWDRRSGVRRWVDNSVMSLMKTRAVVEKSDSVNASPRKATGIVFSLDIRESPGEAAVVHALALGVGGEP